MDTKPNPALTGFSVADTALVYVDYVTGLDNLMTTIPPRQYRNNIAAFTEFSPLFGLPTGVLGEENAYYGTFLPEVRKLIDAGARTFAPRGTPSGYTAEFAEWLRATGMSNVLIGGISIRIGDEVIDASVRGKLAQLADALMN